MDDDGINCRSCSEPEEKSAIILGHVTRTRNTRGHVGASAGGYFHRRADTVAIALVSPETKCDPVIAFGRTIVKQRSFRPEIDDECIHLSIIVVICEARSTRNSLYLESRSGLGRDIREFAASQAAKQ